MNRSELELTVREIVVNQLGVKPHEVVPDAKLGKDLGADQLDLICITMTFEEEFDIVLEDKEFHADHKLNDIIDEIERRLS